MTRHLTPYTFHLHSEAYFSPSIGLIGQNAWVRDGFLYLVEYTIGRNILKEVEIGPAVLISRLSFNLEIKINRSLQRGQTFG
jgi:hypothetical protein